MIEMMLSPDGGLLALRDDDAVRLLDAKTLAPRGIHPGAQAVALRDDAIWLAGGDRLWRHDVATGSEATCALPPGGVLVRTLYGDARVAWLSSAGDSRTFAFDGARIAGAPLALDHVTGDRVVALTTARFVRMRGRELAVLDGQGQTRWSFDAGRGARVVDAGALFDGRWVSALTERGAQQQLVLLDALDGRVQHRLDVQGLARARFASRRGLAIVHSDDGRLLAIDLRFGKVLRQHDTCGPIADLAIDDAGRRLVLQAPDGRLACIDVADLVAGRVELAAQVIVEEPPPVAEVEAPPVERIIEPALPPPLAVLPLCALGATVEQPRCAPGEVAAWLAAQRAWVAALAARAIAGGWDTGAIAFSDEDRPPFEGEVAALALGVRGLATVQVAKAAVALDTATDRLRALRTEHAPRRAPLDALADELGLDELERDLLMLIAAPGLWGELVRLYAILANDAGRAACDEQLLVQLCGLAQREAVARALAHDGKLVGLGLVRITGDRARPFAALEIDPIVLRIARDEPLVAELEPTVALAPAAPDLEQLIAPRAEVERAIHACAARGPLRLAIRGRAGSGRRTLLAALAARAGRGVASVDCAQLVEAGGDRLLATTLRRTQLRRLVPLLDGIDHLDEGARARLARVVAEHRGPLAARIGTETQLARWTEVSLPALSLTACGDHWRARLAANGLRSDDADALAARFCVGPGVVARCVEQAAAEPGASLEVSIRRHLASRLGEVATRLEHLPTWSQVVLPDDIKDSVLELMARLRHRRQVFDAWGMGRVVTTARGIVALFQGPPGTGKTLVAGAIANELGLDVYRIDVSRVISKWVGETERNLAKVFAAAEDSRAILLFDEADSLFAKRTEVRSSNDRYANTEVNYLLQQLDSFDGIAILTTNFSASIDPAVKRRLSYRLTFPFPDDETREQLWNAHLPPQLPRRGALDLASLARRFRMSGGYIRNAALRAAFLAADEHAPLTQDHLERAIRAEFREIGNLAETGVLA